MAVNPKYSNLCVNGEADSIGAALDLGYIRLYNGSQPATADTALSGQTLLAELRFGADAFPSADASANATGTAAWARILASDGSSTYFDGTVGTSSANVVINSTSIVAGAAVSCSSLTLQVSKG